MSLVLLDSVLAGGHAADASARKRHSERAPSGPLLGRNVTARAEGPVLEKRFDNTRFSWYVAGMGACGKVNSPSDFIVALNHGQFESQNYCFQTITITCGGKTTQAQVVDECMECPWGALDFSQGLFEYFSGLDAGYLYGSWTWGAGAPKPTPTPTPKPTPTTTKEKPTPTLPPPPPETTSTSTKKSTTSTSTSLSTTSSSSSTSVSKTLATTSSSTSVAASTPSVIPVPTDAISQLGLILLNLGEVILDATVLGVPIQGMDT
ncbi:hypothetical protein H0H81_001681 [Sphagnurus paluster]|uniref:Uncharacterized protein n=1 Tax=Sphagnurus paluster TaxID=117069 RepID=A0A9P7FQS8_9AGAR|nr:hypothetical protein H0H81_001681 [Sphagnurus paluster]